MTRAVLGLLALLALAPSAAAFGPLGHRLVAALAEQGLSAETRAALLPLLADEPEPSLAGIANWADLLRERDPVRGPATARWHYVNIPRAAGCRYRADRDCPGEACIVAALAAQAALLGDRRRPLAERREALKWVVHLVADIHQPLHAGHPEDKGGNLFQVYLGRGSNLHAVWDSALLESRRLAEASYLAELGARAAEVPPGRQRWSPQAPRQWAQESCALIGRLQIYPPRPGRLPRGYLERMRPHAEERVLLAGLRLARLLEHALGPDRGTGAAVPEARSVRCARGQTPARAGASDAARPGKACSRATAAATAGHGADVMEAERKASGDVGAARGGIPPTGAGGALAVPREREARSPALGEARRNPMDSPRKARWSRPRPPREETAEAGRRQ